MASPDPSKTSKYSKSKSSPKVKSESPPSPRSRASESNNRSFDSKKSNGARDSESDSRKRKARDSPGREVTEKKVKKELDATESRRRNKDSKNSRDRGQDREKGGRQGRERNPDRSRERVRDSRNRDAESRNQERSRDDGDIGIAERGRRDRDDRDRGYSDRARRGRGSGRGPRPEWDEDRPAPSVQEAWGGRDAKDDKKKESKVEKPNYELSGVLAEEDAVHGVQVKYSEPSDGRIPDRKWRLYVFKDEKQQEIFRIHRLSAYLIGKERRVCDIPMHHPSISKQHAVLQFRQKPAYTEDGQLQKLVIKPYIIDLGSTNGTFLNGTQVEALRYYELLEKDVLKFGFSSREYVLLHAASSAGASPDNDDEIDSKLKGRKEAGKVSLAEAVLNNVPV